MSDLDTTRGEGPQPMGQADRTVRLSPEEAGEAPLSQESLLRRYVVLEKIADGGMGIVYLAQDRKLGRYVAIKRLNQQSLRRPTVKQRLFQEARAAAGLHHIHIVHVYELGEDVEGPYIAMEYVPGPPESSPQKTPPAPFALDDKVHRDGPFNVGEALDLMLKIARAVQYAHQNRVIHRDLKPSNILLDESGEPKIVDFGLARTVTPGAGKLTMPGEKMLSLGYGAPEQERDASTVDERADVYGLGALFYFCITGQNPRYFRTDDVPDAVQMVIVKALETDRDKRWPDAEAFVEALLSIQAPSDIELPSAKRTWRCKWCDTINPVSIRFCGRCGWDGGELCVECGAEMRVGVPFCGHCGADMRDNEIAVRLLDRLRKYWEQRDYARIRDEAGPISGFTPSGTGGRELVAAVYGLQKQAEQAERRLEKLRQGIPAEIASKAFESARRHIDEYNDLAPEKQFISEREKLDDWIIERDMGRAQQAYDARRLDEARELCTAIAVRTGDRHLQARRLLGRVRLVTIKRRLIRTALALAAIGVLYVLSTPLVYRLAGREGRVLRGYCAPVVAMHRFDLFRSGLTAYAEAWGAGGMLGEATPGAAGRPVVINDPGDGRPLEPFVALKRDYETRLSERRERYARERGALEREYIGGLETIQDSMQREGDYEGWEAVQNEIANFEETGEVRGLSRADVVPNIVAIQNETREALRQLDLERDAALSAAVREYAEALRNLRSDLTREGKMEVARQVNEAISALDVPEAAE